MQNQMEGGGGGPPDDGGKGQLEPFGDRLRRLLDERELSQKRLGELAEMDAGHVSRLINNKRPPSFADLKCLAVALTLPLDVLVAGSDAEAIAERELRVVPREEYDLVLTQLAEVRAELERARRDLAQAEADKDALAAERKAARAEAASCREERDDARREAAALRAQRDDADKRCAQAQAEADKRLTDFRMAQAIATQAQQAVAALRRDLNQAQGDVATAELRGGLKGAAITGLLALIIKAASED
jgi:transcriptional regulator with XRE-family HTH domain